MIPRSFAEKRYRSANDRNVRGLLDEFFKRQFPSLFGPMIRQRIVEELLKLIESVYHRHEHLQPGQCLWLAVDKATRADSPHRRLRPVVLTMVEADGVNRLAAGERMSSVIPDAIARIMREAYEQGALLSMRDIELLTWRPSGVLTEHRKRYEQTQGSPLPHTGTLHDMGSCITHKQQIVRKAVHQGKDPRVVAAETNHTLPAVERYVRDYWRVRQCYAKEQSVDYIAAVTGLSRHVVQQYIELLNEEL
jgi:hypothetical protein